MALHRAGKTDAKRLRRKLQRAPEGRVSERAPVRKPAPCSGSDRGLARGLQPSPPPLEPRRAHPVGVLPKVKRRPKPEQSELITADSLGSRSPPVSRIWPPPDRRTRPPYEMQNRRDRPTPDIDPSLRRRAAASPKRTLEQLRSILTRSMSAKRDESAVQRRGADVSFAL